jgi:calcium-dependent protein kinase
MNRSLFIKSREDDINDHYFINQKEELGRGSHGRVFVAESRTYRNRRWAVKIINKKRIKLPLTFFNEIEIMKKLDHPNIIKIYETF